jgi:hypothetical protein
MTGEEDMSLRSFLTGSLVAGSLLTGDDTEDYDDYRRMEQAAAAAAAQQPPGKKKQVPGKPRSDHTEGTQDEEVAESDDFSFHSKKVVVRPRRNKLASCGVCVMLLLVLTAEVMVSLVLVRLWRNQKGDDTNTMEAPSSSHYGDLPPYPSPITPTTTTTNLPPTVPSTLTATSTPTATVTTLAFQETRQALLQRSPSSEQALFRSSSPQYRALAWLTSEANFTSLSTWEEQDLDQQYPMVQRWVMATIYYSLRGHQWTRSDNWLSDQQECVWFSVDPTKYCDGTTVIGIDLSNNQLAGKIPDEISLLSNHLGRF